jgi:hypothetical protein
MEQEHTKRTYSDEEHVDEHFSPGGTFLFVILMLVGYALYWAYIWFVVVIEQG